MPLPTPFHSRTAPLCRSMEWRDWAGYLAAVTYEKSHEFEYFAIRNAAALIDVTPLFKYEISGTDASKLVDRIITRDVSKCKIGQVLYTPWCDEFGRMMDDGTVQRFSEERFRITSAQPNWRWFRDCGFGMNATVTDITEKIATLSLQGPNARAILSEVVTEGDVASLRFFHLLETKVDDVQTVITRTGYTGDLGYEIWVDYHHAERLWDILMAAGRAYGITPAGLAAMDIARVEAGLILNDVDYVSANRALIDAQTATPFEAGLGWAVQLRKKRFVGQRALIDEKKRGPKWQLVGLTADWEVIEKRFNEAGLAPQIAGRASRDGVPVYANGKQVGQATSRTFSPILKKYIALATLETPFAEPGKNLEMELTVQYSRHKIPATVTKLPFFNPERKRLNISGTKIEE
ncbi:MAG: aminomethyltransferase family protein [Calditrichia bacterium]|nr:aminomethyltransferase family protein [Calditrichota bacterium]MCB9066831.1 aminomethyl transferase family protein [Calditrichia bacterium]